MDVAAIEVEGVIDGVNEIVGVGVGGIQYCPQGPELGDQFVKTLTNTSFILRYRFSFVDIQTGMFELKKFVLGI